MLEGTPNNGSFKDYNIPSDYQTQNAQGAEQMPAVLDKNLDENLQKMDAQPKRGGVLKSLKSGPSKALKSFTGILKNSNPLTTSGLAIAGVAIAVAVGCALLGGPGGIIIAATLVMGGGAALATFGITWDTFFSESARSGGQATDQSVSRELPQPDENPSQGGIDNRVSKAASPDESSSSKTELHDFGADYDSQRPGVKEPVSDGTKDRGEPLSSASRPPSSSGLLPPDAQLAAKRNVPLPPAPSTLQRLNDAGSNFSQSTCQRMAGVAGAHPGTVSRSASNPDLDRIRQQEKWNENLFE